MTLVCTAVTDYITVASIRPDHTAVGHIRPDHTAVGHVSPDYTAVASISPMKIWFSSPADMAFKERNSIAPKNIA